MNIITGICNEQYELIKASRAVLLEYCASVSEADLVRRNPSFGRGGSIRNLLVHTAGTYQFWIGNTALQKQIRYTTYEDCKTIVEIKEIFRSIDLMVQEFITATDFEKDVPYTLGGVDGAVKPFKLFSHVITHEFHHKGQILALSRHLGYTPVDTDIMR